MLPCSAVIVRFAVITIAVIVFLILCINFFSKSYFLENLENAFFFGGCDCDAKVQAALARHKAADNTADAHFGMLAVFHPLSLTELVANDPRRLMEEWRERAGNAVAVAEPDNDMSNASIALNGLSGSTGSSGSNGLAVAEMDSVVAETNAYWPSVQSVIRRWWQGSS